MMIQVNNFKGEIPKVSDRLLPENNSTGAVNTRLRSGDLEPYNDSLQILTFDKGATVSTIYPMKVDTGSLGWLNWTDAETSPLSKQVDVVKGFNFGDSQEKTYFTGAIDAGVVGTPNPLTNYRPKVTTRNSAFNAPLGNAAPYSFFLLGIPAPVSAPVAAAYLLPTSFDFTSDGSSLTPFTSSSVVVNAGIGNPAPSFQATTVAGPPYPFLYRDNQYSSDDTSLIQFDLESRIGTLLVVVGADATGAGGAGVEVDLNGGFIRFRSQSTWDGAPGPFSKAYDSSLMFTPVPLGTVATITFQRSSSKRTVAIITPELSFYKETIFETPSPLTGTYGGFKFLTLGYLDNVKSGSIAESSGTQTATSYVYTFVNGFGEEGPPSLASNIVLIDDNHGATVWNFDLDRPEGYGLTPGVVRLYRAVTGSLGTQFQFVDEFSSDVPQFTYNDTKKDSELGEVLITANYQLPPSDAINIVNLANGITLLSSKNNIYPSTAYIPYSYPAEFALGTDFDVIAMASLETTVVALTLNSAYLIVGSDPAAMSMSKIPGANGCVSKRSVKRWNQYGIVYASMEGLFVVSGAGSRNITEPFITKEEWAKLYNPSTISGAIHEDIYYGSYVLNGVTKTFSFDVRDNGIGFINHSEAMKALYAEHLSETLFYSDTNGVLKSYDSPAAAKKTYQWSSKLFELPYPTSMNFCEVRLIDNNPMEPLTIAFYADQNPVPFYIRTVTKEFEFLLPDLFYRKLRFSLSGQATVTRVSIAETVEEIT